MNLSDPWVAGLLAAILPAATAIHGLLKLKLEAAKQKHEIEAATADQIHRINQEYLAKALDPASPYAMRLQLLRFLSTTATTGKTQLATWAEAELGRVKSGYDTATKEVAEAETKLNAAKNDREIAAANRQLALATKRKADIEGTAARPPLTAASIRAGLFKGGNNEGFTLDGLALPGADLSGANLSYTSMKNCNVEGANISDAWFQGTDLRGSNLNDVTAWRAKFFDADLRAVSFVGADLTGANFMKAKLHGADFSGAKLGRAILTALYDSSTRWPEGFDPDAMGAVDVDAEPVGVALPIQR